ncbi:hypothetical protein IFU01_18255 [Oxalobacteraceae sp. CFBP 8763]|nr:hypothetical protein [Oxalobacteraceae sp. CFBP 8763]
MTALLPCAALSPSHDASALARRYVAALDGFDIALLGRSDEAFSASHGLSGLFLPGISGNLHAAPHRIIIVGAETKSWEVLRTGESLNGLDAYVDRAMQKHEKGLRNRLAITKQDRGRSFWNFVRNVAKQSGSDGLIWANLFCCAWKKKSPIKSPHFPVIQHYSNRLLKAQVEFFAPSVIIFANGIASAVARRAVFPIDGPGQVCTNGLDFALSHQIPNRQLWQFDLNETIRCYRIHHPSSRADGASEARHFLQSLLPSA